MSVKLFIEGIREAMFHEMERDDRVLVMGLDVGVNGGVFRTTDGLIEKFGEQRVIDTPLAENSIAGVAVGMALQGKRPIAEIQFADFIHTPFDHIISEMAKLRWRNVGQWTVPMVVRTATGGGLRGGPYHSQSPEAFYCHVPGLVVLYPSTAYDAKGMLSAAIRDDNPVLYFEHKKCYRTVREEVPDEAYTVPIYEAQYRRRGKDLSIIAYGYMLHESMAVAEKLAGEGIQIEVLDPRILMPLDKERLVETAHNTGRVLIVHEDTRTLGIGAEMAAIIQEEAFGALKAPVARCTMPDVIGVPFAPPLEDYVMPDQAKIEHAVRKLLDYSTGRSFTSAWPATAAAAPASNGGNGSYAPRLAAQGPANGTAVPQATMTVEVDLSRVMTAVGRRKAALTERGIELSYTPFVVEALAQSLLSLPRANASYQDGGIVQHDHVNIQVVGGGGGQRRRSVIASAEVKNVVGIALELAGGNGQHESAAPTFKVVDLGAGSADFSVPLVESGQAGALAIGAVREAVVAEGRTLTVKPAVNLTLSVDHRLLDGQDAGQIVTAVKKYLEEYPEAE